MPPTYHIKNANIVNEGRVYLGDVFTSDGRIFKVIPSGNAIDKLVEGKGLKVIDASGKYLIPGVIDDQVHFREPGLTYKADIDSESRAAVAGGITSFMDMPNTVPNTLTQELLEEKFRIASDKSLANFSFYMGASNDNLNEILKTDPRTVCGLKVFMGASTGNMLVDNDKILKDIFTNSNLLVAIHSEDEQIIRNNSDEFRKVYGENVPVKAHPLIRSEEACYKSTFKAVNLAGKYNTRLHVLHLSTAREMELFNSDRPLTSKRITSEVCVHHLWFSDEDYEKYGTKIKWNPAVKTIRDRDALWEALLNGKLDVIATDHAPHTEMEKSRSYFQCPSGGPMVQHALAAMMEFKKNRKITIEKIVEKMCHNPAIVFNIQDRGFIREGYWADLVLVDPEDTWQVNKMNILYKCGWSPFEGVTFRSGISHTFVNGNLVYEKSPEILNDHFNDSEKGKRLIFNR